MKTKIEIKSVFGKVLFEYDKEDNTIKDTLEKAINEGADLHGADLSEAKLYGADLRGVDLSGAKLYGADLRGVDLSGAKLYGADLRGVDLSGAKLYGADLSEANIRWADLRGTFLSGANLHGADLRGVDLRGVDLSGAKLYGADLRWAYLSGADLRGVDLSGAKLYGANLHGADISEANIRWADISGATNIPYIPLNCPSDGAFVGWKKVCNKLIKLEIPEDARRSSATTMKCRCDKAKVLEITDCNGNNPINEIENDSQEHHVTYKVGEMVYPDSFDENRWNECSNGIHFFINKQDAINY